MRTIVCTNWYCQIEYDPIHLACPQCGGAQAEPEDVNEFQEPDEWLNEPGGSMAEQYPQEFSKVDVAEVGYAFYQGDLRVWDILSLVYAAGTMPEDDEIILRRFYDEVWANDTFPIAIAWVHSREEAQL